MIVNIILLWWGIIGAGLATLISNFLVWIILAWLSKKCFDIFFNLNHIFKPAIAGVAMYFGMHLNILAGMVLYILVLFLLKGITKDDLRYLIKVIFPNISTYKN